MTTDIDVSTLVDLTLYDLDPQDLVAKALDRGSELLPEWDPAEHNIEVILIELLAEVAVEWSYASNRLVGAVVEALLRLFGLPVDQGAGSTGTATVALAANAAGVTFPAGSRFRVRSGADESVVTVSAATTITAGNLTGSVPIVVSTPAAWPNTVPSGTSLEVIDPVPQLLSVATSSALVGGRLPEDDTAYLARASLRLRQLTEALVRPDQFTAAALEDVLVERATTIDLYRGAGPTIGQDAGHVTVVVRGDSGPLTSGQRSTLATALQARAIGALEVHVIDPVVTTVDVTVSVAVSPGFTAGAVAVDVEASIRQWLSVGGWPWAATVHRNDLVVLVAAVDGVARVVSVESPASDVTLAGAGNLAVAGTVGVNVVSG